MINWSKLPSLVSLLVLFGFRRHTAASLLAAFTQNRSCGRQWHRENGRRSNVRRWPIAADVRHWPITAALKGEKRKGSLYKEKRKHP